MQISEFEIFDVIIINFQLKFPELGVESGEEA